MKRVFTRAETMQKKKDENPSSLVRSLMGYGDVEISTYPIKHGISMELHAKRLYSWLMRQKHPRICI